MIAISKHFFSVGTLYLCVCIQESCISDVDGLELDICLGLFFYCKAMKAFFEILDSITFASHPTQDISTWSSVFHLHTLLVLSSLREVTGQTCCLAGCLPCWAPTYLLCTQPLEFRGLCWPLPNLSLCTPSPQWYIQEQRKARRTRETRERLETGCKRAQESQHTSPCPNSVHHLLWPQQKKIELIRQSKAGVPCG